MKSLSISLTLVLLFAATSSDVASGFGGRGCGGMYNGGYGGCGLGMGGYGGCGGYGGYGMGGYGGYDYGRYGYSGYGLGGYGTGYGGGFGSYAPARASGQQQVLTSGIAYQSRRLVTPAPISSQFVVQGEALFRAGQYQAATEAFRRSLKEDPSNAGQLMLLAQSQFQSGQWADSAATTERAMTILPNSVWGRVVQDYSDFYGNIEDYTRQLRALEAAASQNPTDPKLRFLLGFHYGYLTYRSQAERELNKAVELHDGSPARQLLAVLAKPNAPLVGIISERTRSTH